jgi:hypothetical protein
VTAGGTWHGSCRAYLGAGVQGGGACHMCSRTHGTCSGCCGTDLPPAVADPAHMCTVSTCTSSTSHQLLVHHHSPPPPACATTCYRSKLYREWVLDQSELTTARPAKRAMPGPAAAAGKGGGAMTYQQQAILGMEVNPWGLLAAGPAAAAAAGAGAGREGPWCGELLSLFRAAQDVGPVGADSPDANNAAGEWRPAFSTAYPVWHQIADTMCCRAAAMILVADGGSCLLARHAVAQAYAKEFPCGQRLQTM